MPGETIDVNGEPTELITKGRHDPCVGIRAVPIAEAMLAIVLMDHLLRHRGQNQGVVTTTPKFSDALTPVKSPTPSIEALSYPLNLPPGQASEWSSRFLNGKRADAI